MGLNLLRITIKGRVLLVENEYREQIQSKQLNLEVLGVVINKIQDLLKHALFGGLFTGTLTFSIRKYTRFTGIFLGQL